jgi:uncharacterized Zn-binding protein involved in type VI secretion
MAELWAVEDDENTHGGGKLIAGGASSPQTVKINGKNVIVHESPAGPDDALHPPPPTDTAAGSGTVFCYGAPVHRHGDPRQCGATTLASGQSTVKVG